LTLEGRDRNQGLSHKSGVVSACRGRLVLHCHCRCRPGSRHDDRDHRPPFVDCVMPAAEHAPGARQSVSSLRV